MIIGDYARLVMQRADVLGGISEEADRLTRRFATESMRRANEQAAGWMRQAGMEVRQDAVGNLLGRYAGADSAGDGPPTSERAVMILGSHLDTVRDAGKYDGPLGVLVAIACVQLLHDRGVRLPFDIEVAAFADEEGLRYNTSYLGSKAYSGQFDPAYLGLKDADGISLREALLMFGGDPGGLQARSAPDNVLGYCEVHIEQGPVLEARGLPAGVVPAISSQSRFSVTFTGEAGHAGTVPVDLRRDALCAAAEFVLEVEAIALETPGLVATVGQLDAQPGASNVIPGRVVLSLDVRHMDGSVREESCRLLKQAAVDICARRYISLGWEHIQTNAPVLCSPELSGALERAVAGQGIEVLCLPSGAGHDGVVMSAIAPIAMLFVRCKGGVSHNPAESVDVEDVAVAIEVMGRFLEEVRVESIRN